MSHLQYKCRGRDLSIWSKRDPRSAMVVNVSSLASLAMAAFLAHLEHQLGLPARLRQLQKNYVLPARLRQDLMDHVLASGRIYNSVDLNIFEFLMNSEIRSVNVRHVRKWYREKFLLLLKEHGSGLNSLQLEEIDVSTESVVSLASTLCVMKNLSCVSLRFVCDDATLWSIGRNCLCLEEIDVEGSFKITDLGIQTLCLRGATLPVPQTQTPTEPIVIKKGCFSTFTSALKPMFCFSNNFYDENVVGISWWRTSLLRRARKNSCCTTLKTINIRATCISRDKGVTMLETCCPQAHIYF